MKPKTKSELIAEWASQPDQLKKEREVKAIRKAMDDARAAIQDGLTRYGYDEITADKRDRLLDLWEARETARNSRKAGDSKYHDLVTEMLETAIRRVGNEYADLLFEHDQQCREAEKQCEQLAAERMRKS